MIQHEVGYVLMRLNKEVLLAVGICDGEAVNAPGVSS